MDYQQIDKVLVFDVWGDYAHFRRFYTTTSPLTFPIPPRTALCGLIGAIMGLPKDKNEYLRYFTREQASIGLRLINPVKKVIITENLINTKGGYFIPIKKVSHEPRTQINFEFLKDQKYRIYFHHTDEDIYQQLKENLINHKTVYTPCLGLSEHIADFEFIDEFQIEHNTADNGQYIKIHSVLPSQDIRERDGVRFNLDDEFFSIRLPVEMTTERVVTRYSDILFERNGRPLEVKINNYLTITHKDGTKENFVFIQ